MRLTISHLSVPKQLQLLLQMLLLTEPRLLVMVRSVRQLQTETERSRSPRLRLRRPKDKKRLRLPSVYSFSNKKR